MMAQKVRILVVEDEAAIRSGLVDVFVYHGYEVKSAENGNDGLREALGGQYDLILLDVMLPGKNGLEVLREWRQRDIQSPILMLSGMNSVEDTVKGLELGADDYLKKPFAFEELVARIRALLRRGKDLELDPTLQVSDLELDPNTHEVRRAGELVPLTPREFALLEFMMRRKERVLSRALIEEQVWGCRHDAITNVVHVYIRRLRDKLDRNYSKKLIHTVRGVGYQLKD
jgi:two-component system copper resistance phosphate regulon response regulator CusR